MMFKCDRCGRETPNDEHVCGNVHIHCCDDCKKIVQKEVDFQSEGETWMEDEIICPWCGHHFDGMDVYEYFDYEDGGEEQTCPCCHKHFDLEVENRPRYSTQRSLCDMPDDWEPEEDE